MDDDRKQGEYCSTEGSIENRLTSVERLTFLGGKELEKLFTRLRKEQGNLNLKPLIDALSSESLGEAGVFYRSQSKLYASPQGVFAPKIIPVHGLSNQGEISDIEFESAYKPFHQTYRSLATTIPENQIVRTRLWKHTLHEAPTIVCVHGWTMGDPKTNALAFLPGFFFRLGFNVAIFELPFHGRRLTPEFREIGHSLFPSANLYMTNEALLQSVSDLRQLRLILKALGLKKIGALGISLGSCISAKWAQLEPLSFVANILPFFSFANVAAHSAVAAGRNDIPVDGFATAFGFHDDVGSPAKTQAAKFISMENDPIIPASELAVGLYRFPDAKVVTLPGEHELLSSRSSITNEIVSFLEPFL